MFKCTFQMGSNLLSRFREILDDDRVHDLTDGGPEKALLAQMERAAAGGGGGGGGGQARDNNLRIIGEIERQLSLAEHGPLEF